jgi:hypothetical protein
MENTVPFAGEDTARGDGRRAVEMSRMAVETGRQTLESTRYVSVYKAVD